MATTSRVEEVIAEVLADESIGRFTWRPVYLNTADLLLRLRLDGVVETRRPPYCDVSHEMPRDTLQLASLPYGTRVTHKHGDVEVQYEREESVWRQVYINTRDVDAVLSAIASRLGMQVGSRRFDNIMKHYVQEY